ncbi:B12-binding domain-containing radical SAM protein [Desulfomonile tiedjei]|uniref:Fe-S oxidoreductase n=1 Tax=Desulfomonile tiedjei (strain ATCC 49306 / DSM 6799 / DCB-1) TaxID=706587 RepID=I4C1Q3_DESTA|nr:radical SAM protein [Desulfomonile tiedjei]AFM23494.1 Fe-S oxidoreductase [Desulfomonile tiedjei DSM 6799]
MSKTNKRVLFINPTKKRRTETDRVHLGFCLLGSILSDAGHETRVLDLSFLQHVTDAAIIKDAQWHVQDFRPDVIGISVFSFLHRETVVLLRELETIWNGTVLLGGPHFAVFPEDFREFPNVDYVVRGEAENVILDILQPNTLTSNPTYIDAKPTNPDRIPRADLSVVYGNQHMTVFQIQLSRGCNYQCSFCSVHRVAGRQIRSRRIEECLEEIIAARSEFPAISNIVITDDCPGYDSLRLKQFLRLMAQSCQGVRLYIDNMRADIVDEELLELYVAAGGENICLGAESGHPEVFKKVHKGESLEKIRAAAGLVKKHNLLLGLCFIIGLPGDTPERHYHSVRFARSLEPDYCYWNMVVPWPGTAVYKWYEENGTVEDQRNFTTLVNDRAQFDSPICDSREFPKRELIRAWLIANMETHDLLVNPIALPKIMYLSIKYRILGSFLAYCIRLLRSPSKFMAFINRGIQIRWGKIRSILQGVSNK